MRALRYWGGCGLLALAALDTGCAVVGSSEVDPSAIYTDYQAEYDAGSWVASYRATFQVGNELGTYVDLDDGISAISLDGESMTRRQDSLIRSVDYRLARHGFSPRGPSEFLFIDRDGREHRNPVRIPAAVAPKPSLWRKLVFGSPYPVGWESMDRADPHEVNVEIVPMENTSSRATIFETDSQGGITGTVTISAEEMYRLGPGAAKLRICRRTFKPTVDNPGGGGSLNASYCAAPVSIQIQ